MSNMIIEKEATLTKCIKANGCNLIIGAGFSVYAKNEFYENLPIGSDLIRDLVKEFKLPENYINGELNKICNILKTKKRAELYEYLLKKYYIPYPDNIPAEYYHLLNLPIRNIITTNIDNLVELIYQKYEYNKILHDALMVGKTNEKNTTTLYKIHGSVTYDSLEPFLFGSLEMSSSLIDNLSNFLIIQDRLSHVPLIVWGSSVTSSPSITTIISKIPQDTAKWIILKPDTDAITVDLFKSQNFNLIYADTLDFLTYINDNKIDLNSQNEINNFKSELFSENSVDSIMYSTNHPVRSSNYFYSGSDPIWYDVIHGAAILISHFDKAVEEINKNNNLFRVSTS